MNKVFALVDCNNFFVSCERVFNPAIQQRPVVVLSNNDGCIIARSQEAKALGIPMGAPYFKHKRTIEQNGIVTFSSNYQLYGDMSHRVMSSLRMLAPNMAVYSIDEAFLRLDDFDAQSLFSFAVDVRAKILQWTGIPTSFGIAPTKTMAKIANHVAKKHTLNGVFDMRRPELQTEIMQDLPIEELWGISSRWGKRLRSLGIRTALELRDTNLTLLKERFGVVVARIVLELRGVSTTDLDQTVPKKSIMSSRSFGKRITALEPMEEALANYAARACEKLRMQKSKAQGIYVFLTTPRFRNNAPQYRNGATLGFDVPTSDTSLIINAGRRLLKRLYRDGYQYKKCGIMLMELVPENYQQQHLFERRNSSNADYLMQVLDQINHSMGAGTVFHAAQGVDRDWQMKSDSRSPRYTTQWDEIVRVS